MSKNRIKYKGEPMDIDEHVANQNAESLRDQQYFCDWPHLAAPTHDQRVFEHRLSKAFFLGLPHQGTINNSPLSVSEA